MRAEQGEVPNVLRQLSSAENWRGHDRWLCSLKVIGAIRKEDTGFLWVEIKSLSL